VEYREEVSRTLALVSALLLVLLGPAAAQTAGTSQTTEAALAEFGLLGTWALDCKQPPGKDNIFSIYEKRDGQFVNVHDAGPAFEQPVYVVRAARPAGAGMLAIETVGKTGRETTITLRRVGDRIQVWKVLGADGFSPVSDGKYIVTEAPIPPLTRCR
jgi:hypothetical protein